MARWVSDTLPVRCELYGEGADPAPLFPFAQRVERYELVNQAEFVAAAVGVADAGDFVGFESRAMRRVSRTPLPGWTPSPPLWGSSSANRSTAATRTCCWGASTDQRCQPPATARPSRAVGTVADKDQTVHLRNTWLTRMGDLYAPVTSTYSDWLRWVSLTGGC